jgi:hypothetical protein
MIDLLLCGSGAEPVNLEFLLYADYSHDPKRGLMCGAQRNKTTPVEFFPTVFMLGSRWKVVKQASVADRESQVSLHVAYSAKISFTQD